MDVEHLLPEEEDVVEETTSSPPGEEGHYEGVPPDPEEIGEEAVPSVVITKGGSHEVPQQLRGDGDSVDSGGVVVLLQTRMNTEGMIGGGGGGGGGILLMKPSPATTPEPSSMSSTSLFTSWLSSSSQEVYDAKTYKNYIQAVDKCLKNFEYSIEWPDLIAALTKLNKVISSYNATLQAPSQSLLSSSSSGPPPPLPRTHLITKRLSQCLHPNLPSGVHLKTLETFDLIFQGFRVHDYVHLECDLFSFVSGLLPLWSYAAISVKPKLLSIYETHLVNLGERLRPALNGIMLSLFNGLVDDGVEQDIKIRINSLLQTLEKTAPNHYVETLNSLIQAHPSIHLPLITHIQQISYQPPPPSLIHFIRSPNTLVQRNALELLKSYDLSSFQPQTQVRITTSTLETLLKRDMSLTRRVFSIVEPRQHLLTTAIEHLINDCTDSQALTRILSTLLDNPNVGILPEILPQVVRYLMKCEYNVSVSFLSTINASFLSKFFINHLFEFSGIEDLESRTIVLNYVLKLGLFDLDYDAIFGRLVSLRDDHLKVILQMIRLHYSEHKPAFVRFYNEFMATHLNISEYELLQVQRHGFLEVEAGSAPPDLSASITSTCFEFVCELMRNSEPDDTASKYIVLGACTSSAYTLQAIRLYVHFQDSLTSHVYNTHAPAIIFRHAYALDKPLLNGLKYPEKYLLSVLHEDSELTSVLDLDLHQKPLVVLKLVDPATMDTPYRRFIAENFIRANGQLVLNSILKYLEFQVDSAKFIRAKSESNLIGTDEERSSSELASKHAASVLEFQPGSSSPQQQQQHCAYDSARVATLLDKLDFAIKISDSFLTSIDLIVLLSKLTVLSTISNTSERSRSAVLQIQTHALRTIRRIVSTHGDSTHSFVYDSILNHLSGNGNGVEALLWELAALPVVNEFLRFDLENYTLASVLQKCLNCATSENASRELIERVQIAWLTSISNNLAHVRRHLNALVLITFTSVCRNLLEKQPSEAYTYDGVHYLTSLLTTLLPVSESTTTPQANTGFLSSLFGTNNQKMDTCEPGEAMRSAILSKLDLVIRIGCRVKFSSVRTLLGHLATHHEPQFLSAMAKCFDVTGLDNVVKELRIPATKLCHAATQEHAHEAIHFIAKYLRVDKTVELTAITALCRLSGSRSDVMLLISAYVRACGANKSRDLQDLVVRTIELTVDNREFTVLEAYIPGIFDLVWGETGEDDKSSSGTGTGASASSASVRDQKIIVSVVHGIVVALVVAIKSSSPTASSSYNPALHVLEQVSHHSYLRKAWKKEIFDLITNEQTFFYFTPECLGLWKIIVDNLFTQDRSTFSELITRLTQTIQMSTSALSNIFSSKDSEVVETRSTLLKRLAFVIHSSEKDQYAKYLTSIQEKIADALKIGSGATPGASAVANNPTTERTILIPAVNNAVFLCFRIMVLKFNCNILTSLWPIIVHEVVTVLQTLYAHMEEHMLIASTTHSQEDNPQQQQQQPPPPSLPHQTLSLYLQTLKLLNFLFTLPSDSIPHFQLYKWAFVDQPATQETNNNVTMFVPYVSKLKASALCLFGNLKFCPPLRIRSVSCLFELCSAFGELDVPVPEHEWEVIDFCDGLVIDGVDRTCTDL